MLSIERSGYITQQGKLVVAGDKPFDVELELQKVEEVDQPAEQPAPSQRIELPAGLNAKDLAGIKVIIRYRGAREDDALVIEERLASLGIQVTAEQDTFLKEEEQWNRIYYPACHEDAARAIRSLLSDLLRLTLMRSRADCNPLLDLVVAS